MAYNYGPPPGAYGARPPSFAPPTGPAGMSGTPNFAAPPGMDYPPGMQNYGQAPAAMRGQFQAPPNMPNINFNAPVIRLGLDAQPERGGGGDRGGRDGRGNTESRGRPGLGADSGQNRNLDRERQQLRESMLALQPLTREEVARTVFIGGLVAGVPNDEQLEVILRCAGKLRRWTRGNDAEDKRCKFGFAEYEDVESLEAASEIFPGVRVPLLDSQGHVQKEDGADGEVKMAQLLVVVDDQSKKYIEDWKGRRKEDDSVRQFRIDGCKEDLRQTLANLASNDAANGANGFQNGVGQNGDHFMSDANGATNGNGTEVVTIPVELEDELADIPAEMRATVAEEIKAFRDRSVRRDLERLRREEELELEERRRSDMQSRAGVPAGPRAATAQGVQGAPSGPKGFRGAQLPSDYANGVAFVSGGGSNGLSTQTVILDRDDEDAEESDEELERQRQQRKETELDKRYQDAVRRWQNRERTRGAARDREKTREEIEQKKEAAERDRILAYLEKWDDDKEARDMREEYYANRSAWVRRRASVREAEARADERDRQAEQREKAEERKQEAEARGQADNFLDQMGFGKDVESAAAPATSGFGGFKINLGGAAGAKGAMSKAAPAPASTEIEGLLEDEDAVETGGRRTELKPLTDTSTVPLSGEGLTDQEKREAQRDLATEMPTNTEAIFNYPIRWASLTPSIINNQLRPFIEKKVVYYLGVQEELLVDTLLEGVKERRNPRDLVKELEPALEEDAESLVTIVWKLVALSAEVEGRGLAVTRT